MLPLFELASIKPDVAHKRSTRRSLRACSMINRFRGLVNVRTSERGVAFSHVLDAMNATTGLAILDLVLSIGVRQGDFRAASKGYEVLHVLRCELQKQLNSNRRSTRLVKRACDIVSCIINHKPYS